MQETWMQDAWMEKGLLSAWKRFNHFWDAVHKGALELQRLAQSTKLIPEAPGLEDSRSVRKMRASADVLVTTVGMLSPLPSPDQSHHRTVGVTRAKCTQLRQAWTEWWQLTGVLQSSTTNNTCPRLKLSSRLSKSTSMIWDFQN
eukprot:SAG31_NODE_159_length_21911_cov_12.220750_8_plen_144_part_00